MAYEDRTASPELDRNLAFLAYGFLFFAVFFAGAPALIAVAIAHSRRNSADPLIRRHHAYQIWVFWIGFGLALLAGGSALAFLVTGVMELVNAGSGEIRTLEQMMARVSDSNAFFTFLTAAIVLTLLSGLWLSAASAYGFFRLASGKPIVQTRQA
jgi:uncharacterized membrane protein